MQLSLRQDAAVALPRSVLAGFVASLAMLIAFAIAFVVARVLGGVGLPLLTPWFQGLTSNALIDMARPNLYTATVLFLLGGLVWSVLYGLVFEHRLSGPAWRRGLVFALVPWLFSLIVFLPLIGGGLLGMGLGAGPLPMLGNLILHGVYGAVLGAVFATAASEDILVDQRSERGAARGLVLGLAAGAALGIVASLVPTAWGASGLNINPLAMVVPCALVCGAFGSYIGSLSGA